MKKLVLALLLTAPALALASPAVGMAPQSMEVVEAKGAEILGQVIYQSITQRGYIQAIHKYNDRLVYAQGVEWEGTMIYKRPDGACIEEERIDLKFTDKETSLGVIQLPSFAKRIAGIKCPS